MAVIGADVGSPPGNIGDLDTALIAQNVYLFAASQGLATVILGNVDRPVLAATLGIGNDQILTFTQPVGHRE